MHISWVVQMLKSTNEWKKLTTWWSQAPNLQTFWCLSVDKAIFLILPCYLNINQSQNYAWAITYPGMYLPHLAFKNDFLKPFGEFCFFGFLCVFFFDQESPILLAWPSNKPFPSPNASISASLASLWMRHMNLHSVTLCQASLVAQW